MRRILLALSAAFLPHLSSVAATRITIVLGEDAVALERRAASELADSLRQLFEAEVTTGTAIPADESAVVLVGSPETHAAVRSLPAGTWPKLSDQGHVVKSIKLDGRTVLLTGGGSPVATLWAVHELDYRLGIRHLLHGDHLPVEKPAFTVEGFDVVMEPRAKIRAWSGFNGQPFGADAWSIKDHERLLRQLGKLKFTHLIIPGSMQSFAPIRVDGDTPGRKAFQGAKEFTNPDFGHSYLANLTKAAADAGIVAVAELDEKVPVISSASDGMILPQAMVESGISDHASGFVLRFPVPGDHSADAHYFSRAAFQEGLTPAQALSELAAPICGKEVDARLLKGFAAGAKACALVERNGRPPGADVGNEASPGIAAPDMMTRQLASAEPPPAWWNEAKTLYTEAMNEMYRANTRARDGARPFILYHAKRFEFGLHYLTCLEAARKAGNAKAAGDKEAQLAALDQAVEAIHNALNALGDVARDPSDRGTIAVLNELACRPLIKALEDADQ